MKSATQRRGHADCADRARAGHTDRVHTHGSSNGQQSAVGAATVWLLGSAGQLGTAMRNRAPDGVRIRPLTSDDIDLTEAASVTAALRGIAAGDIVVNAAAYTAVDRAESEPDRARAVNGVAPGLLGEITAQASAWLIHVSTDYVFTDPAGVRRTPYEPDDTDPEATPASVYGATKRSGEIAALTADPGATVVRTAWVYTGGPDSSDFVGTMRRLEQARDTVSVVDDQTGSPTYAPDLADGLWELVLAGPRPQVTGAILHATNAGSVTWFEVARAVFAGVGADPERVRPCSTSEFPRPAPRPAYSVLSPRSWIDAGLTPFRTWSAALDDALTAR